MENKTETKQLSDKAQWIRNNYDPTKHIPNAQYKFNQRIEEKINTIESLLNKLITK